MGCDVTPAGQSCWQLVGFHVKVGPNVIMAIVRDRNGNYLAGKWVNWYYPGISNQLRYDGKPAYFTSGISVETKNEDNEGVHFTISGDHNVAPDTAGPDSIWVAAEPGGPQFSDAVHGLGMRVNTNHLIVSPIFQEVVKTTSSSPPPPPVINDPITTPQPTPSPAATGSNYVSVVIAGQEIGRIELPDNITPLT